MSAVIFRELQNIIGKTNSIFILFVSTERKSDKKVWVKTNDSFMQKCMKKHIIVNRFLGERSLNRKKKLFGKLIQWKVLRAEGFGEVVELQSMNEFMYSLLQP